jgi:hypothetical protein
MEKRIEQNVSRGRLMAGLGVMFIGALLAGALLAPHLFNGLLYLGRSISWLEGLRYVEFEKVANRCVIGALLVAVWPGLKLTGLNSWRKLGLRRSAGWKRHLLLGLGLSIASMVILYIVGWSMGAYYVRETFKRGFAGKMLTYFVGAILVGLIEETFFRGAIFGMLRKGFGLVAGAMLASVLFSAVHFASPEPTVGVVYGHWDAGLRMLPHMFSEVDFRWEFGFMAVTLFLMGLTLCFFYAYFENIYLAMGLHAGWVWGMKVGDYFIERARYPHLVLFGPSMTVAKSVVAILLMSLFMMVAIGLLVRRRQRGTNDGVAAA